jgi:serine protease Do
MKTKPLTIHAACIAAALVLPASAIEAPADNAPPPPATEEAPQVAEKNEAPQAPKEDTAYLGVVSSEVPPMLAEHLGLKEGEGIIVRSVMPDGPAAKAGLATNDIITRVADKPVGSSQDLTKNVTSHKPGEKIRLDVIQKGKAVGIDVELGTRPAEIAGVELQPLDQLNLDGVPREFADRVRGMIEGNIGGIEIQPGGEDALGAAPQMDEAMRQMRERMQKAMQGLNGPGMFRVPGMQAQGNFNLHQGATIRMMDEEGSIELKSNDGGKEVTLRDKDEKITWTGPWDTDQDKAAAPDDVRKRVEKLNIDTKFNGKGLRLRMGGIRMPEE